METGLEVVNNDAYYQRVAAVDFCLRMRKEYLDVANLVADAKIVLAFLSADTKES